MFRVCYTRIMTGALILSNLQTTHGMKRPGPYTRKTMMGSLGNAPIQSHWPARASRHLDENTNHRSMRRRLLTNGDWTLCYTDKVYMKKTQDTDGRDRDHSGFGHHKIDFHTGTDVGGVVFAIQKKTGLTRRRGRTEAFKIKYILFGTYKYDRFGGEKATYLVFTINTDNKNVRDRHIILAKRDAKKKRRDFRLGRL